MVPECIDAACLARRAARAELEQLQAGLIELGGHLNAAEQGLRGT